MAERLDFYDFSARPRRRPLPEEWFDGAPWRLEFGSDYDVKTATIQVRFKQAAKERGRCSQTRIEDEKTIVVQAVDGVVVGPDPDTMA